MGSDRRGDPGDRGPKSLLRYLTLAVGLAGIAGEEIDLELAQDLAAELSRPAIGPDGRAAGPGRLLPFVEWAGGAYMAAAQAQAAAAANETLF